VACRASHRGFSGEPPWFVGRATVAFRASHRGLSGESPWLVGRVTVAFRASHRDLSGTSGLVCFSLKQSCAAGLGYYEDGVQAS